ncbi:MAG TPA: hypothetical protein VJB62_02760, partial [Patescibacteria group bacterium]|nr:hypothetical protein [Patescibacteria group bacterium]
MKQAMLKVGISLIAVIVAVVLAVPAQALIYNVDVADNAGIAYSKLTLTKKITSKDIKNGSIKSKDIDDEAIEEDNIEDDAVTSDKIDDGTITADDIAAGTLTATTLADGSVTSAKILDGTIAATDIATGAVATAEILNGTILGEDLAAGIAITTSGTANFTGDINLGADGDDDVVIVSDNWSVAATGNAYFNQVLVTGDATALDDATLVMEGATGDDFETFFYAEDPTADREIIFPNVSGTVVTDGDTGTVTSAMILDDEIVNADIDAAAGIVY